MFKLIQSLFRKNQSKKNKVRYTIFSFIEDGRKRTFGLTRIHGMSRKDTLIEVEAAGFPHMLHLKPDDPKDIERIWEILHRPKS